MSQPLTFEEFEPVAPRRPSVRERQAEASIGSSQASAASSEATVEEKRALLPSRVRSAAAGATLAETKAEQAKMALEKAKRLQSTLPSLDKIPAARDILLREIRNLAQAKELSQTMFGASGIGHGMTKGWSGSPAATVQGLLDPILGNEAFTALSEMRAASPTGGALGNVTERELDLLKAAGGFVPSEANDEAFQQGVDDLIAKRIKVLNRMGVDFGQLAEVLGPANIEQFAPMVEAYRFRQEDQDALDSYIANSMEQGTFDPSDFAALMGQAYYRATGNRPDDAYIQSALDNGIQIMEEGRTGLGDITYSTADEDAREAFLSYTGSLEPDETSWGEALGGAALNFIPSTFELAADTARAFTIDLPETMEGIVDVVAGATGLSDDDTAWEALKDYYVDRYGSVEGFKRTLREDPASIMADIAGIATGGAGLAAKGAMTAGKVGQIGALANAARRAEGFAQAAAKLDPLVMAGRGTAGATRRVVDAAGVQLPATLAGVTPETVRQAVGAGRRGSQDFLGQLEGTTPAVAPIDKMNAAISELYQSRSKDYQRRMKRLKKDPEVVAFDDVEKAIEGVRQVGRHKGIDISGASGVWDEVDNKVMEFFDAGLNTVEDFDAMKRSVGNIRDKYQKGTPEYKVANDVYKSIDSTIRAKAPIYADIMKDYREASDVLSDVQSTLSTNAGSKDTILRKLQRQAAGRGPRGGTVLDVLENTRAGKGLGDMIAGQNLASPETNRMTAALSGVTAAGTGSAEIASAAAVTPQRVGRAAYGTGRAAQMIEDLPPVEMLRQLTTKYGPGVAQGVRTINPIVQAQVDPLEGISEEAKQRLLEAYVPTAPQMLPLAGGPQLGQDLGVPNLDQLTAQYSGPMLDAGGAPAEQPATGGPMELDGRPVELDPTTGQMFFVDTGEPVQGYKRGGEVKGYKEGGLLDLLPDAEDVKGFGRSVAEGAMFGYNDELEAWLGTLRAKDPKAYEREVERIRRAQLQYKKDHPGWAFAGEMAGAVGTAFVPGMQGLSAARVAAMGPKARAAYELALGAGQGALYGTGKMYDDPDSDRDPLAVFATETAAGTLGYPMGRVIGAGGRKLYSYAPQSAKDFAVRQGRKVTDTLRARRPARR